MSALRRLVQTSRRDQPATTTRPQRRVVSFWRAARRSAPSADKIHMFQDEPAWVAHQRARWLRPDAHLFVRPDAHRFMPPGVPRFSGKDAVRYFWPDAASDRLAPAPDHKHDASLAAARASLSSPEAPSRRARIRAQVPAAAAREGLQPQSAARARRESRRRGVDERCWSAAWRNSVCAGARTWRR